MTKEQALFQFWMHFELPAYNEQSVPTGDNAPDYPYITYEVLTDSFGEEVNMTASIWDRSHNGYSADLALSQKVQEISDYISRGGITIRCDDGIIWIKRGTPFSQSMGDPSDDAVRRKIINIKAEFITAN